MLSTSQIYTTPLYTTPRQASQVVFMEDNGSTRAVVGVLAFGFKPLEISRHDGRDGKRRRDAQLLQRAAFLVSRT
jgi:hypothetical protein